MWPCEAPVVPVLSKAKHPRSVNSGTVVAAILYISASSSPPLAGKSPASTLGDQQVYFNGCICCANHFASFENYNRAYLTAHEIPVCDCICRSVRCWITLQSAVEICVMGKNISPTHRMWRLVSSICASKLGVHSSLQFSGVFDSYSCGTDRDRLVHRIVSALVESWRISPPSQVDM